MDDETRDLAIVVNMLASGSFRPLTRQEKKQARVCSICDEVTLHSDPIQHVFDKRAEGDKRHG